MTPAAWGALGIAVFGAICYAAGSILQAVGARRSTGTVRTLGHPLYLLGVGCDILSWAGSMVALRELAVYQVQSVLAGSLAITVVMARVFLGSRVRRRDAFAVVITVGALAVLAMSAGPQEQVAASTTLRIGFCAAACLTVILGWLAAKFTTPGVVAGLSGLAFGGAALAGRALTLPEHPTSQVSATLGAIFTEPLTAALVVFAAAGMLMYTHALQHGQVGPVTAVLWIGEVVAPSAVGLALLGDTVLPGWQLRAAVAGFIVVASAVILATAPATSDTAQPAQEASPAPARVASPAPARALVEDGRPLVGAGRPVVGDARPLVGAGSATAYGQPAVPAATVYAQTGTLVQLTAARHVRPAFAAATGYPQPAGAGFAAAGYSQPAGAGFAAATGQGQSVDAGFTAVTGYGQTASAGLPHAAPTGYGQPADAGFASAAAPGQGQSAGAGFAAGAYGRPTTEGRPAVGASPAQAAYPVWPPPSWHEPTPPPGRLSSGMTVWWGPANDRRPIFIPPDRPRTAWAPAAPTSPPMPAPRPAPGWEQHHTGYSNGPAHQPGPAPAWTHHTGGVPLSPPPAGAFQTGGGPTPLPAPGSFQTSGGPLALPPVGSHPTSGVPVSGWPHPTSGVPTSPPPAHQASAPPAWADQTGGLPMVPQPTWAHDASQLSPRPTWAHETSHEANQVSSRPSGAPVSSQPAWAHDASQVSPQRAGVHETSRVSPPPAGVHETRPSWADLASGAPAQSAHPSSPAPGWAAHQPQPAYQSHPAAARAYEAGGVPAGRTYQSHQPAYAPPPTWTPQASPEPAPAWINHGGVPTLAYPSARAERHHNTSNAQPVYAPREQAGWA